MNYKENENILNFMYKISNSFEWQMNSYLFEYFVSGAIREYWFQLSILVLANKLTIYSNI